MAASRAGGCPAVGWLPAPCNLQANTERRRDILSTLFIGRELLKRLDDFPRTVIDLEAKETKRYRAPRA